MHEEVDRVMGDRSEPTVADYMELKYTMRYGPTASYLCPASL